MLHPQAAADAFSVEEIGLAAGVSPADARAAVEATGRCVGGFVTSAVAVACVRQLRQRRIERAEIFEAPPAARQRPVGPLAVSGALHVLFLAIALGLTALHVGSVQPEARTVLDPPRLVFLATPGPGGGGGGGGLKQREPIAKAELKGAMTLRSPVPPPKPLSSRPPERKLQRPRTPPLSQTVVKTADPPPPAVPAPVTPQIVAPVATTAADPRDRAGVLGDTQPDAEAQGSGSGGGAGTGQGSGIGEGTGAGIGPGSGAGTGGGPYRAGSGITAPTLLHEVRPEYTDDARRRGLEGDVILEIVVRRDGTVGDVKVLRGLGGGLERRAIDAVRQWRFSPARRTGTPVDVYVEVAVEFKLR